MTRLLFGLAALIAGCAPVAIKAPSETDIFGLAKHSHIMQDQQKKFLNLQ